MHFRIVVASQTEAMFYDLHHVGNSLQFVGRLTDPLAHLHDRDFKSDRPGRKFDHAPLTGGRRGATGHHGIGAERRPRKHEAIAFAQQIADQLERARQHDEFDRLVVVAPPAFLGLLRKALPESVRESVAAEVDKNLLHQPPDVMQSHLPDAAFLTMPRAWRER
jgi:protein required for attachment to host cells